MALTLKIDGFDFSQFVRLQPGDGFDPSNNPVDPLFGDESPGEGNPLLGFSAPNKPMSWPVHVTPLKTADADTKDGLHSLVAQINLACRDAKRVEWRDDGATVSTFFDVVAAKFEPDHSYWKARKLYLSGVLKVWVRPYGDTGTMRLVASTFASGGVGVAASLGAFSGDVAAQVRAVITVGSQPINSGRIVGIAAIPSGYTWDIPAGSIALAGPVATLQGASGAPGSQIAMRVGNPATGALPKTTDGFEDYGQIALSPASMYVGRNRVFAVAQSGVPRQELRLLDAAHNAEVGRGYASAIQGMGFNTVDFGAFTVPSQVPQATLTLKVQARVISGFDPFGWLGGNLAVGRMLVVPEDTSAVIVDTRRTALTQDFFRRSFTGSTAVAGSYDELGVQYGVATDLATGFGFVTSDDAIASFGWGQNYLVTRVAQSGGYVANYLDATVADLDGESVFYVSPQMIASSEYQIGKWARPVGYQSRQIVGARVHGPGNATQNVLNLVAYNGGNLGSAPTVLACVAFSRASSGAGLDSLSPYVLRFRSRGNTVSGQVFWGTSIASYQLAAATALASLAGLNGGMLGNPYFAGKLASSGAGNAGIVAYSQRFNSVPSDALRQGDKYVFDSQTGQSHLMTGASAFVARKDGRQTGENPKVVPSMTNQLVAFNLPLDSDNANDLVAMDVRIRERFQYHAT